MSNQMWPEGYYPTDGLVGIEFTDVNAKDCCKLTFQMTGYDSKKEVLLFFTGGAERISYETLQKLGWNGDPDKPACSNPKAFEQLKCEHYTNNSGVTRESWKIAGGGKPLPMDRRARLAAGFKASQTGPQPSGRPAPTPTAPTAARPSPAPTTAPPASRPAPAPSGGPPPSTDASGPPASTDSTPVKTFDKNAAWTAWEADAKPKGKTPDVNAWNKVIDDMKRETGKLEGEFGHEEWKMVAEAAAIPF